jgi:hypothetical protein
MAERYVTVAVLDREVNDSYYPKRKYRANVQFYRVARHTVVTFLESIVCVFLTYSKRLNSSTKHLLLVHSKASRG